MGLQVSRCVHPEVPTKTYLRKAEGSPRGDMHELAKQKQSRIVEGHLRPDHVHMCISIPPKFSVSSVVGFIKGKSAISIARNFLGRRRNFTGESFWARGYFVSTVGLDEVVVREYIRNQEKEDRRLEQLNLDWSQGAGLARQPPLGGANFGPFEGLTEDKPPALPGVNLTHTGKPPALPGRLSEV